MSKLNHLTETQDGIRHICETGKGPKDITLVWTLCCRDVPANKSFKTEETANCGACLEIESLQSQLTAAKGRIARYKTAIQYMLDPYPEDIFPEWPHDKAQTVIRSMTDEQRLYLTNSNGVQGRHVAKCILAKYDELTEAALKAD